MNNNVMAYGIDIYQFIESHNNGIVYINPRDEKVRIALQMIDIYPHYMPNHDVDHAVVKYLNSCFCYHSKCTTMDRNRIFVSKILNRFDRN